MNSQPKRFPVATVIGSVMAVLALVVWPAASHWTWTKGQSALHAVPAFFLGLLALVVLGGVTHAIVAGCRRGRSWILSLEALRTELATVALALSIVVLFYGVELWRGKHAYAKVVQEAVRLGEPLDWRELQMPVIPDQDNLLSIPMLAPLRDLPDGARDALGNLVMADLGPLSEVERWGRRQLSLLHRQGPPPWMRGEPEVLDHRIGPPGTEASVGATPEDQARAMLERIAPLTGLLDAMADASRRPFCRFPAGELNPIFSVRESQFTAVVVGFLRLYEMRSLAHLRLGQPEPALENLMAGLNLANHLSQDPALCYQGPRAFETTFLLQPLWEGIRDGRWTDNQLAALQRRLARIQPLTELPNRLRFQRMVHADLVESMIPTRSSVGRSLPEFGPDMTALRWVRRLYPRGWSLMDQAAIHAFYFDQLRIAETHPHPATSERSLARQLLRASSDPFFGIFLVPRVVMLTQDSREYLLLNQVTFDLATTACAVERHHRMRGTYPQHLDDLKPELLSSVPHDPITGDQLRYRMDEEGYVIYSVALDGVDNGGHHPPDARENHSGTMPVDGWDWVWRRNQAAPPPQS